MDSTWILIGVILLLFVGLYFFSNYSNRKRAEAHNAMIKKLRIGDKVTTIGGVYGVIYEIGEEYFVIETGSELNKSYIKFNIGAIANFMPQAAQAAAGAETPVFAENQPAEASNAGDESQNRAGGTEEAEGSEAKEGKKQEDKTE